MLARAQEPRTARDELAASAGAQLPRFRQSSELSARDGSPLADPRRSNPVDSRAAEVDDASDPPFRTVFYDPTTEDRELFTAPERLPPIESPIAGEPAEPESTSPQLPAGAKSGVLQQLTMSEAFLAGGNSPDSLGINEIAFRGTLGFPFFTVQSPLLISPGYTMHLLDGPQAIDVPPRLYEAYVEFRWLRRLTPRWGMDLAVMPGVFSDFNRVGPSSLRIQGRALGAYEWNDRLRLVAGVLYLDRDDIRMLPAGGAIWIPNDDARYEIVFPRPRFARRLIWNADTAWWGYLLGELGGNSYGVTRANGVEDTLTYRDLRLLLGLERKVNLGISAYLETGYVFGRELEYLSGPPMISPPGTVMVRGGLTY